METFFGVALIIAGSIWFLWLLYSLWKGRKSEDWNITTGIITKSDVIDFSIRKGHGTCPIVHYEYSILGKTYKSDRIFSGARHSAFACCKLHSNYRRNCSAYDWISESPLS
jgi:hypothetical protein